MFTNRARDREKERHNENSLGAKARASSADRVEPVRQTTEILLRGYYCNFMYNLIDLRFC